MVMSKLSHFVESLGGPSSSAWKSLQQLGLVGDTLRVWAASQATRAQALSGRVASLCTKWCSVGEAAERVAQRPVHPGESFELKDR